MYCMLVGMMSHVLCHNISADGEESESWLAILFSFQRLIPSFWHLAQDVRVYFLQELQCNDFLVETKLHLPCI